MSHSHHESMASFHPDQILVDGCIECQERGATADASLRHLDQKQFARAWRRAADWQRYGCSNLSLAEIPLLEALWGIQVHLQEISGLPIGELPARWPQDGHRPALPNLEPWTVPQRGLLARALRSLRAQVDQAGGWASFAAGTLDLEDGEEAALSAAAIGSLLEESFRQLTLALDRITEPGGARR